MDIQASLGLHIAALQKEQAKTNKLLAEFHAAQLEHYRAEKHMRLPLSLQGTPSASAINLGESSGQICGPRSGYAWSVRRLVVDGLTAGTTPDIVNLYRSSNVGQPPLWQFNGNNFGYTFGKLELVLWPGDTFNLVNVGTIAATGIVRLSGELDESPAEMLMKLL